MHIYLWAMVICYGLAIVADIALIGKPRKTITPADAAIRTAVSLAAAFVAAMFASGVWK